MKRKCIINLANIVLLMAIAFLLPSISNASGRRNSYQGYGNYQGYNGYRNYYNQGYGYNGGYYGNGYNGYYNGGYGGYIYDYPNYNLYGMPYLQRCPGPNCPNYPPHTYPPSGPGMASSSPWPWEYVFY